MTHHYHFRENKISYWVDMIKKFNLFIDWYVVAKN